MRGNHLLNWAGVICSLLLPLTAMAGSGLPKADASGCSMSACRCDCCQPGARPQCNKSHSPCAGSEMPCLTTSHQAPGIDGVVPYKTLLDKPAAKIFISSIDHPPRELSCSSFNVESVQLPAATGPPSPDAGTGGEIRPPTIKERGSFMSNKSELAMALTLVLTVCPGWRRQRHGYGRCGGKCDD